MRDAIREIKNRDESQVHRTTVQRNLKDFGVKAWVKPKKLKLEPHQKHARYVSRPRTSCHMMHLAWRAVYTVALV